MLAKITKSTVDRLSLNSIVWDTSLVGFGVRRQRRHPFYILRYRMGGRQRFITIGRHGMWTPDTARNEAKRLLGLVAGRVDPGMEREVQRKADTETFSATLSNYLERKRLVLRPRSFEGIHHHLMVHCKPLHRLSLGEIDRRAIAVRLGEIETARGPRARNKVRASLSAFFNFAIREGLTETNPVAQTGKAMEAPSRDRVLTQAELSQLLRSLDPPLGPFSDIIRLLVLTGQRRTEIGSLRWSEVDLDRGLIVLPPTRTKNKRLHEVPISRQVRAILERQPRKSEWVWGRDFNSWAVFTVSLRNRLNRMADWSLHDLRRTAATMMAELGILPHIIEAILNHVSGHKSGVAGIYNRARYEGEMRQALQKWADRIDSLIH